MRFRSFLKETKKQRRLVEKRKKRKADELSNPVRKKIRVKYQSQTQDPSSPPSSLSPPSFLSPNSPQSSLSPLPPPLSALSPSSAPSSSTHVWLHDVFPSFRGEDVRDNFLSHIKKEFGRKTITFFNDNGIERGESIAPELIRGIRASKIAIVLLSRNYASSKWCLEELVEIMNCREELGQTVIAIFYKVDPSHVKKLTGDFGEVFRKTCEGKAKEEIRRWKQALEKVATIAGYHSCNWVDEAAMIEDICTDVYNKLNNSAQSSDFDNLVGMRAHMTKLELLLRLDSNEVRMIGIWGPSGIGKSTIARVLFSQYSREFQFSVFMENIKRRFPRPYYDEYSAKLQLQKEFMSQIINREDMKIQHLGVVEDRLKDKRVLAILDDVDHSLQIEAIAKEARWFGPGSRIIITTQDKSLLNAPRIDDIYEVEFPPDDEALEIFCMYAFGQKSPRGGFKELACEVTKLAGDLPLGLKVIGSYFEGRPKQEWEEDLPRLRSILDGEIESILKFSYDALCVDDQNLFLHLSCFFNYETPEIVEGCLAKKFVGVKGRLRGLAEKSFISFERSLYIEIHDLLARLGREIVRKQSIHEPGKRQFLVDAGDICQVLRDDDKLGSRNVIGIDLDLSKLETELKISDGVFARMSNVQFLRVKYGFDSIAPVTCLPPNLRILDWDSFPMTCLPSSFNPEFLVKIILTESNYLEKLWEGNKTIRNLKLMNLSDSINLTELPDLSTATSLQELNLRDCSSLTELPFSIGNAINLRRLDLSHCSSLVELPSSMENITTLENLLLTGCSHIAKLPSSIGNLKRLYLENCSSLEELPSSVINSFNLKAFACRGCTNLVELPLYMDTASYPKEFELRGCSSLRELPSSIGNITILEDLYLGGCSSLVELPSSIGSMTNLRKLSLNECTSLVKLPSSIGDMSNLRILFLERCSKLTALPVNINMKSLDTLVLTDCSSLKVFPEISTNIGVLKLTGTAIEQFPPSIMSWPRLRELVIKGCTKLVSLPQLPDSLEFLVADNCGSLERLDCSFHKKKFNALSFVNCFKLNQAARDLIINTSKRDFAIFPGETVPTYFTYRATGSTMSMTWSGLDTQYFPTSLRFKACLLLVYKGDVDAGDRHWSETTYCIKDKLSGVKPVSYSYRLFDLSPTSGEHLFIFEIEETVSSPEIVFEFEHKNKNWEIKECGTHPLETLAPSC
ncbi:disease resistance protein TAO1 [Raphanus sativus]|uniref:ADP-ribosyl cyclase/cyclic ADP-ribose hydrolase n=1 Tax=Raphanus sativus TaxID=3726 RepID=A0A6J0N8V5_RAPSA|nr:disease resistance protein TAO1 [Raphanus sativus]